MTRQEIMYVWFGLLSVVVSVKGDEGATPQPTLSPLSDFIASPQNKTVLEGHSTILRCKMKEMIHNCQWFYLESGLDILDQRNSPTLVKEFRPTKKNDCSIKFSKARQIQSGQWICKGLQIHARKYIVSHPAYLQVIPRAENIPGETEFLDPNGNDNDVSVDITFHLSDEGHIVNTKLGDTAVLVCRANKQVDSCAWIRPDGTKLQFQDGDSNANYIRQGNYSDGNCSLKISSVSAQDEGNWRCVVSTSDKGDKLGPLIHLHVLEFGSHTEGPPLQGGKVNDSSLVVILVVTSTVLLLIIVGLIFYMYKRVWHRNSPPHKYFDSNKSTTSDYSAYGSTWLPSPTKDQKLIDESTEMQGNYDPNKMQNTRYLDMTGNKRGEGYIVFPNSSVRSSMSSRTTLSTMPVGQNAINDSDGSARTSASDSLHSVSASGNATSDHSAIQSRQLPQRSESVYSSGHLYEEIDETKMRRKKAENGELPEYANTEEDPEGYMIPKACSPGESITMEESTPKAQNRAPPYSKVSATGLIPDSDAINLTSNPTYSEEARSQEPEESYDAPNDPPVPLRIDSVDNPLAEYDVPKSTSTDSNSAFV